MSANPQESEAVAEGEGEIIPVKPKTTPLPRKQVIALSIVLMTESICSTMLLPFVGLYVAHIQNWPTEKAGYTSGILVGLFMLGQVVSCKLWGYLSDVYGRKVPLTSGLVASAWCMLFFGLAPNIYVCCILRFLHGFFNGNVLIAKTIIADITDKTNEAQGFALISITWGVGTLFGPAIGGFLYDPAHNPKLQWMHFSDDGFYAHYPAFLPSFVIFLYSCGSIVACVFFLKETNPHRRSVLTAPGIRSVYKLVHKPTPAQDVTVADTHQETAAVDIVENVGTSSSSQAASPNAVDPNAAEKPAHPKKTQLTYAQAMRIPSIRNITIFYVLLAGSDMVYSEILPLWTVAPSSVGGMDLFSDQVGMLILAYSVPSIIANVEFHRMCRLMKSHLVFWRFSILMYNFSILMIPFGASMSQTKGFWYVLMVGVVRCIGCSWSYSLIHMLTAKSSPPGCVGSVYGISQSCASMVRCVVPFIAAPLFAWSISGRTSFPFNYWLIFLLAVTPTFASVYMSYNMEIVPYEERTEMDAEEVVVDDAPNSDEDEDEAGATFLSLMSSFCTNPIHDTLMNVDEMEAENAIARSIAGSCHDERTRPLSRRQQMLQEAASHQQREEGRALHEDEDIC